MKNLNDEFGKPRGEIVLGSSYQAVCRLGGVTALLTVLAAFFEIAVTFLPGGRVVPETVVEWYSLLENNSLMGLRNLGLVNIVMFSLGVPMYVSLYFIHSKLDKERAALAMIISLMGTAIFFATNRAFPLLELSRQYAQAPESQKMIVESAGMAMLAVGRSHSPGTFVGFALGEVAGIYMSLVMLRNRVFSQRTAITGVAGFSCLLLFEIWSLLTPTITGTALIFALVGAVLNIVWLILLGLRFFSLAGEGSYPQGR